MELKGLVDMILSVQGGQCVNIHTQSVPHQDHLVQGGLVPEPPTLPAPVCVTGGVNSQIFCTTADFLLVKDC